MLRRSSVARPPTQRWPRACGDPPEENPHGGVVFKSTPRLQRWYADPGYPYERRCVDPTPRESSVKNPQLRVDLASEKRTTGTRGPRSALRLRGCSGHGQDRAGAVRVGPALAGMLRNAWSCGRSGLTPATTKAFEQGVGLVKSTDQGQCNDEPEGAEDRASSPATVVSCPVAASKVRPDVQPLLSWTTARLSIRQSDPSVTSGESVLGCVPCGAPPSLPGRYRSSDGHRHTG